MLITSCLLITNCGEHHETNSPTSGPELIHHQIILENNTDLPGIFYLNTGCEHNYFITPNDSTAVLNGTFSTQLKDWYLQQQPYFITLQYLGSEYGCADVTINTFVNFELYHSNNFIIGSVNNNNGCDWNGNSIVYDIIIEP